MKASGMGPRAPAKLKQLQMRFPSLDKCVVVPWIPSVRFTWCRDGIELQIC